MGFNRKETAVGAVNRLVKHMEEVVSARTTFREAPDINTAVWLFEVLVKHAALAKAAAKAVEELSVG